MKSFILSSMCFLSVCALAQPALASGGYGMTWRAGTHGVVGGVDVVGCNLAGCNAYTGDRICTDALPVLCIHKDGSSKPSGLTTTFYYGWAGGVIATTPPIQGTALTSVVVADQICAATFGTGWQMAEFHDGGGGWNWYAYGYVRTDLPFWVRINDTNGNCWN